MKYGRKGTAGGSWGRLPFPQSLLVVIVDKFLDVVELFVKVLETRVGLLTLRVRLGANKLFFDPLLHLLQQIAVRLLTRWLVMLARVG